MLPVSPSLPPVYRYVVAFVFTRDVPQVVLVHNVDISATDVCTFCCLFLELPYISIWRISPFILGSVLTRFITRYTVYLAFLHLMNAVARYRPLARVLRLRHATWTWVLGVSCCVVRGRCRWVRLLA